MAFLARRRLATGVFGCGCGIRRHEMNAVDIPDGLAQYFIHVQDNLAFKIPKPVYLDGRLLLHPA
jgi:hypothetical protein